MNGRAIVAAALCVATSCAGPRSDSEAGPARGLALPPGERFVFASGTSLTIVPMHELPLVSVRLFVEGGARLEPAGKTGLSSFTAGLLDEGPAGMTRAQFLARLDRLGAEFESSGSLDGLILSLDFLARDLDAGLDLLFAAALAPSFGEEAVARARERTLGQLVAAREDEEELAREAFFARLFPDHRYGRPLDGTEESVRSFTRDEVAAFHRAAFAPASLRIVVAGDVQPAAAGLAVERAAALHGAELGVAMAAQQRPFEAQRGEPATWPRLQIVLVHKPEVAQPQVLFGCRGPGPRDPDLTALRAANVPFGGGFTSWLVDRLRVDLGLTYGAGSAVQPFADGGVFYVRTFTKSATVVPLLKEAFALLDRLARGELDDAALARARRAIVTRTVERMETTSGVADLVKDEQLLGLGADSVARLSRELDALTLAQVRAAVARHLPDSRHVLCVVVGDQEQIAGPLGELGDVEVIDYRTSAPIGVAPAGRPGARW